MPRGSTSKKSKRAVITSSSSSSEEEQVPRRDLFISDDAEKRYNRLAKVHISTGAYVQFEALEEYQIRELFEYQGWVNILTLHTVTYAYLVKLFYANLSSDQDSPTTLTSNVDRTQILLTPSLLSDILNIPNVGYDIYYYSLLDFPYYPEGENHQTASILMHGPNNPHMASDLQTKSLVDRAKILVKLLSFTLIPKTGSRDKYSACHKLLVYCLLRRIKVNLPSLLLHYMFHISEGFTNLYYGKYITHILEAYDIDVSRETETVKEDRPFGYLNINLMKSSGSIAQVEPPAPPPVPPQPVPPQSNFESRVFENFERLYVQNDYNYNRLDSHLNYHMSYLYQHLNFPPPPPFVYQAPGTSGGDNVQGDDDDDE